MVRATAAEMLKLTGGVHPPPHDATSYGNLAAQVDTIMDTEAEPGVLSTTGTKEIALANRIGAYNLVPLSLWVLAGAELSGKPRPPKLTQQDKTDIKQLLGEEMTFLSIDMIDEDA